MKTGVRQPGRTPEMQSVTTVKLPLIILSRLWLAFSYHLSSPGNHFLEIIYTPFHITVGCLCADYSVKWQACLDKFSFFLNYWDLSC